MATLLNELTRGKMHTNNPIPVGTNMEPINTHRLMWLSIVQTYLSSNKCSNGAATADVWASEMKTKVAINQHEHVCH